MKPSRILALLVPALVCCAGSLRGQTRTEGTQTTVDGIVRFDKIVHDFGDVMLTDGPLRCTFTVTNISSKPMAVYNVISSCGCTGVEWTREPIQPGKSGSISASYSNDEGPYPFDKNLTVYVSGVKKPVILRLRGVSHAKKQSLAELYPLHIGPLGVRTNEIKLGNMTQGSQRSDAVNVANLSKQPVRVSFSQVSPGLDIEVSPNPIPAGGLAKMTFTVTADRDHWGKCWYHARPLLDGKAYKADGKGDIHIWTFTKEDFSGWTQQQRDKGAQPRFKESTWTFGKVKAGTRVDATFSFTNDGKSPFVSYKADADWKGTRIDEVPTVNPGEKGSFQVHLDTTGMPKGEALVVITLTTNSPLRPMVNLFLAGAIE